MMKKLLLVLALFACNLAYAQDPYVKFINNIPQTSMGGVDVYMGTTLVYDNLGYREGTDFMLAVLSMSGIQVGVAPENSTSSADVIATANLLPTGTDTVIAVFNGTFTSSGYNPYRPVTVNMYPLGRTAATDPNYTNILFANGSTDAPVADIRSGYTTWGNNLNFGGYSNYIELKGDRDTVFRITNATGSKMLKTYALPVVTDSWSGKAMLILATGFVNPAANNNGPQYELLLARSAHGPLEPLTEVTPESYARLQLVHNGADPTLNEIDVYMDNTLFIDNMPFRTSTEFMDVPAAAQFTLNFAPKTSSSVGSSFYGTNVTLDPGKAYVVIGNGIINTAGHTPAITFRTHKLDNAQEEASFSTSLNTDYIFHNGCTDCPTLDIRKGNTSVMADDLDFGEFTPAYIIFPSSSDLYVTDMTQADTLKRFEALPDPNILASFANTVIASGFVAPQNNSNGPAFGLYASSPLGGPLVPLAVLPLPGTGASNLQLNGNIVTLWPNPAANTLYIRSKASLNNTTATIYDLTGRMVLSTDASSKSIDIAGFTKGTYFIRLQNIDGQSNLAKFIKQ